MTQILHALTLVVRDHDEAIAFFVGTLGFDLLEDTRVDATKRWVRVRPSGKAVGAGGAVTYAPAAGARSVRPTAKKSSKSQSED